MKIKKYSLYILTTFLLSASLFAQSSYFTGNGGEGKTILLNEPAIENPKDDNSDAWLATSIKRYLINDFKNYSNFEVIDNSANSTIKKLQKEFSGEEYSEENGITIGNKKQAQYYIDVTISRIGKTDSYSIYASANDIEKAVVVGTYTSAKNYTQDVLISKQHNEIAVDLLSKLGVEFTEIGKRLIFMESLNSSETISITETRENIQLIHEQLANLENQKKTDLESKLSVEAEQENARLETQKQILLQKQKQQEESLRRLEENEKRMAEEELLKKDRDSKNQAKILKMAEEIEAKAAKLREEKVQNLSAELKIALIESEKSALFDNRNSVAQTLADFEAENNRLYEEEKQQRINRKPRKAETDDGETLNDFGKTLLENDISEIEEKYNSQKVKFAAELEKSTINQDKKLCEEITKNVQDLEKQTYEASSLTNTNLYLAVGDFSTTIGGWEYTIFFYTEAGLTYSYSGILTYKEITGKEIPEIPSKDDKNYNKKMLTVSEYMDEVESYDSFFRMNVPYVEAKINYTVTFPEYNMEKGTINACLKNLTFTNVVTQKVVQTNTVDNYFDWEITPYTYVDWRTITKKTSDTKKAISEQNTKKRERKAERRKSNFRLNQEGIDSIRFKTDSIFNSEEIAVGETLGLHIAPADHFFLEPGLGYLYNFGKLPGLMFDTYLQMGTSFNLGEIFKLNLFAESDILAPTSLNRNTSADYNYFKALSGNPYNPYYFGGGAEFEIYGYNYPACFGFALSDTVLYNFTDGLKNKVSVSLEVAGDDLMEDIRDNIKYSQVGMSNLRANTVLLNTKNMALLGEGASLRWAIADYVYLDFGVDFMENLDTAEIDWYTYPYAQFGVSLNFSDYVKFNIPFEVGFLVSQYDLHPENDKTYFGTGPELEFYFDDIFSFNLSISDTVLVNTDGKFANKVNIGIGITGDELFKDIFDALPAIK